jgi:DNA-binding transcriptional regulator of glucitol operon
MKLRNKKKSYILLAAICFALISIIALYFSLNYENSIQGTHNKGMYNMFKQIEKLCLYTSIMLFIGYGYLWLQTTNKLSNNK